MTRGLRTLHLGRVLLVMLAGMILANLGGAMFYPFFAILLKQLGLEVDAIGLYFTLAAIFPLLFQVIGGWISDRIGRLRSIAFGSVAGAISWVGIILAPSMAWPVAWFLAADALGAATRSLVGPSFDASWPTSPGRRTVPGCSPWCRRSS